MFYIKYIKRNDFSVYFLAVLHHVSLDCHQKKLSINTFSSNLQINQKIRMWTSKDLRFFEMIMTAFLVFTDFFCIFLSKQYHISYEYLSEVSWWEKELLLLKSAPKDFIFLCKYLPKNIDVFGHDHRSSYLIELS